MIVIDELRAYMEALALGMWAKGAGQPLIKDDVEVARRALQQDLEGPWRDLQTLAAGIVGVAVLATISGLHKYGLADAEPALVAELLEKLPLQVLNEGQIEIADDEDEPCETRH